MEDLIIFEYNAINIYTISQIFWWWK